MFKVLFDESLYPTTAERAMLTQAFTDLRRFIQSVEPQSTVEQFGSQVSLLAVKSGSDIDLAVNFYINGIFAVKSKNNINQRLNTVARNLRDSTMGRNMVVPSSIFHVKGARVPIIKLKTANGIKVDISMSNNNGCRNSMWMRQMVQQEPFFRPLTVLAKKLLHAVLPKGHAFSSYAMALTVWAFLEQTGIFLEQTAIMI